MHVIGMKCRMHVKYVIYTNNNALYVVLQKL